MAALRPNTGDGTDVLPYLDAAVVSISDIGDRQVIDLWADIAPVLIVTKGSDGARLHSRGDWHEIAPFSAQEVDPTGAGDVFAAAYLIRYQENARPGGRGPVRLLRSQLLCRSRRRGRHSYQGPDRAPECRPPLIEHR